jgi:hypothetical protein
MDVNNLHTVDDSYQQTFLPKNLVKLVIKIAKAFGLSSYDEFSLLETIQHGLYQNIIDLSLDQLEDNEVDQKRICCLIINIIRITEKFNTRFSIFTKIELISVFKNLGLSQAEFDRRELDVMKSMRFRIMDSVAADTIYHFIGKYLPEVDKRFMFEVSLDILRLVFLWKTEIYSM